MLLQSHDPHGTPLGKSSVQSGTTGYLHLLPAIPSALASGEVEGLRARGGFSVDIEWRDMRLVRARITSHLGKPFIVRYDGTELDAQVPRGESLELRADSIQRAATA